MDKKSLKEYNKIVKDNTNFILNGFVLINCWNLINLYKYGYNILYNYYLGVFFMPRVNNVIKQVSQLNTHEQGKVFEFLKNVLMSNVITNSVNEEIAENRFNKGKCCPFCNHDKILSMENIMVKKVLSKDINIRIQIAKKLSMTFLSLQFQVVKRK